MLCVVGLRCMGQTKRSWLVDCSPFFFTLPLHAHRHAGRSVQHGTPLPCHFPRVVPAVACPTWPPASLENSASLFVSTRLNPVGFCSDSVGFNAAGSVWFGSALLCSMPFGSIRFDSVNFRLPRLGSVRFGSVW